MQLQGFNMEKFLKNCNNDKLLLVISIIIIM